MYKYASIYSMQDELYVKVVINVGFQDDVDSGEPVTCCEAVILHTEHQGAVSTHTCANYCIQRDGSGKEET